ncbi:group II intron maturase-specific domain-containing protein [Acidithiobacillus ferrivorans]
MRPSKKSVQRMVAAISAETTSQKGLLDAKTVVERLNRMLEGWANYFYLGPVRKAYRALDEHATRRLRRWLCMKHKVAKSGGTRFPHKYLYQDLGLVRLPERTRNLPWAKV